jgi:hypothetical protein
MMQPFFSAPFYSYTKKPNCDSRQSDQQESHQQQHFPIHPMIEHLISPPMLWYHHYRSIVHKKAVGNRRIFIKTAIKIRHFLRYNICIFVKFVQCCFAGFISVKFIAKQNRGGKELAD